MSGSIALFLLQYIVSLTLIGNASASHKFSIGPGNTTYFTDLSNDARRNILKHVLIDRFEFEDSGRSRMGECYSMSISTEDHRFPNDLSKKMKCDFANERCVTMSSMDKQNKMYNHRRGCFRVHSLAFECIESSSCYRAKSGQAEGSMICCCQSNLCNSNSLLQLQPQTVFDFRLMDDDPGMDTKFYRMVVKFLYCIVSATFYGLLAVLFAVIYSVFTKSCYKAKAFMIVDEELVIRSAREVECDKLILDSPIAVSRGSKKTKIRTPNPLNISWKFLNLKDVSTAKSKSRGKVRGSRARPIGSTENLTEKLISVHKSHSSNEKSGNQKSRAASSMMTAKARKEQAEKRRVDHVEKTQADESDDSMKNLLKEKPKSVRLSNGRIQRTSMNYDQSTISELS